MMTNGVFMVLLRPSLEPSTVWFGGRRANHYATATNVFKCQNCGGGFPNKYALLAHRRKCHPDSIPSIPLSLSTENCIVEEVASSLVGVHRQILFTPSKLCVSIEQFKEQIGDTALKTIQYIIKNGKELKISFSVSCDMHQLKDGEIINKDVFHFKHASIEFQEGDEEELINAVFTKIESDIDIYERRSSGWIIDKLIR